MDYDKICKLFGFHGYRYALYCNIIDQKYYLDYEGETALMGELKKTDLERIDKEIKKAKVKSEKEGEELIKKSLKKTYNKMINSIG